MREILYTELDNLTLSPETEQNIFIVVDRMEQLEDRYAEAKLLVMRMQQAVDNGTFTEWTMKNPTAPNYPTATKTRDTLREQRNQEFYAIKSAIFRAIAIEHPDIHSQYLNYQNLNEELGSFTKCLKIPYHAKYINDTLRNITYILEEGLVTSTSEKHLQSLATDYEKVIALIKDAYLEEMERQQTTNDPILKPLHFIEEINWKEAFTILSFLSILMTDVYDPILQQYQEPYNEYQMRFNFIFQLNQKMDNMRDKYIEQYRQSRK